MAEFPTVGNVPKLTRGPGNLQDLLNLSEVTKANPGESYYCPHVLKQTKWTSYSKCYSERVRDPPCRICKQLKTVMSVWQR